MTTSRQQDLFGKSFDQQVLAVGPDVSGHDISPNRRVPGEIVFEPIGSGIRVTARDEKHRLLWGYVGSKDTVKQVHCLVAVYDTLQDLLAEELGKSGLPTVDSRDPINAAQDALGRLEKTVKWLRECLEVKKVSEATKDRARAIARIASDADRQIVLETGTMKGMKSRGDQKGEAESDASG